MSSPQPPDLNADRPSSVLPPPPPLLPVESHAGRLLFSDARPHWYVILMYVATMGLYQVVWMYRGWRLLLGHYGLRGNAVVNALFAPLCAWSFFRYAFRLGETAGTAVTLAPAAAASLYFVFTMASNLLYRLSMRNPELSSLDLLGTGLTLLALLPLHPAITAMNAGYALLAPERRPRTALSPWAIVFLVIGALIWGSALLSLLFPGAW